LEKYRNPRATEGLFIFKLVLTMTY